MRINDTVEMKKLASAFEPYLKGVSSCKYAPKEAVEAEKLIMAREYLLSTMHWKGQGQNMESTDNRIFVDNDTKESLLLDLPPEEIDRLYEEIFNNQSNDEKE